MSTTFKYKVAALVACYNRKQKTLDFIDSLVTQPYYKNLALDIYLLDDASTDGTEDAVKNKYPFVHVVKSEGNLFWVGAMIRIWEYAIAQNNYDLFILFNDDVLLFNNSLEKLINAYGDAGEGERVIIGSTLDNSTGKISYGGNHLIMHTFRQTEYVLIEPDDNKLVPCKIGNANILLIDAGTVNKIGIFSKGYIHIFADFDYTLTAYKAGIKVFIAPGYYGYCHREYFVKWLSGKKPLKERIKYMYHPKGVGYAEQLYFVKRHFPSGYFASFAKLWLKTLFPSIWDIFRKKQTVIESSNPK